MTGWMQGDNGDLVLKIPVSAFNAVCVYAKQDGDELHRPASWSLLGAEHF